MRDLDQQLFPGAWQVEPVHGHLNFHQLAPAAPQQTATTPHSQRSHSPSLALPRSASANMRSGSSVTSSAAGAPMGARRMSGADIGSATLPPKPLSVRVPAVAPLMGVRSMSI